MYGELDCFWSLRRYALELTTYPWQPTLPTILYHIQRIIILSKKCACLEKKPHEFACFSFNYHFTTTALPVWTRRPRFWYKSDTWLVWYKCESQRCGGFSAWSPSGHRPKEAGLEEKKMIVRLCKPATIWRRRRRRRRFSSIPDIMDMERSLLGVLGLTLPSRGGGTTRSWPVLILAVPLS